MFLLTLAFAVFAWGLHYKLSLYRSAEIRQHQPAAKLLSQKERPSAVMQMECLLHHGPPAPVVTRLTLTATVAALRSEGDAEHSKDVGRVEPEANLPVDRFRHLDSFAPRGPPITV
jgi:hypothetical protein